MNSVIEYGERHKCEAATFTKSLRDFGVVVRMTSHVDLEREQRRDHDDGPLLDGTRRQRVYRGHTAD